MMILYKILGWLNIAVASLMLLPIMIQTLNPRYFKISGGVLIKAAKCLRKLHRPLGIALFTLAIIHGVLALGGWYLHTGIILGFMVIKTAVFGMFFQHFKKKWLFVCHKISAGLLVVMILVHLIFPSAIYYLFGI